MLVYRIGGNPTSRWNTNTNKWVEIYFFMLEHRRFRFFPCLREQPGKQSSACSPSSQYRLSYVGKPNKLFLVLFRIFLTAFPLEKDGCQHSSSSPFLAGNHEYTFEDWRERTKKITGLAKTRSLSRKSPVFFCRISFSYNVFVLFPFQFEIKQCAILLPWKLFLSNESRSFCTRLFLFRFINRNRITAQMEYALKDRNIFTDWVKKRTPR